jgi:signal transduction histidine kinase/ligand-binding sensor protein
MEYKLEDLIDIKLFQKLQDKLNEIYSFPSAIIDNEGNILTATAWQDICTKFHRVNSQSEQECIKSDQYILDNLHLANPAVSYRCPHGMTDNATPIIIAGKHLANFFTGQLFLEEPDMDFFRKRAAIYGFDETEYLEAVRKVPVWSKDKLDKYLAFIKEFTQILADVGLKHLQEIEVRKNIETKERELQSAYDKLSVINKELRQRNNELVIERQNSEKIKNQLEISKQRLSIVFNNATDMLALLEVKPGRELHYIAVNKTYIESGISDNYILNEGDFLGKTVEDVMINTFHFSAEFVRSEILHLWEVADSNKSVSFVRTINTPAGNVYLDTSLIPVQDDRGTCRYILWSSRNITKLKRAELDLIKAKEKAEQSDRLKTAFLANISHEIRTPMNGILGFSELLKKPGLSFEKQQNYIEIIAQSGERLLNTINDIIDISKIETGIAKVETGEININDKMESVFLFFKHKAEAKGLQLRLSKKLLPEEECINTDSEKACSVLNNLVNNGIKFTKKGSVEFGCVKNGEYLMFFVKDSGIGIPESIKSTVFESFSQGSESYTRGYEGIGLGLSISKNYIEMLGGKIWFESEINKGTTFYFTIPYAGTTGNKMERKAVIDKDPPKNRKLKILIAEDDEISYSLILNLIKGVDSSILHAINGKEAVQLCKENPDIDLVLMDIRMPEMSGLEATRLIRQFNKELIIIAQTAYAFSDDHKKSLEAGCNDYLPKPLNKNTLISTISKYC